ncbi:MAG: AAA family ATPase, partial [Rhodomicrobium sp.]
FEALIEGLEPYVPDFGLGSVPYPKIEIVSMPMLSRFLPADENAIIFAGGQSEGGKTYLCTGLAMSIASGKPFLGAPVRRRAAVIYAAAEGQGTIGNRVIVAARHMGITEDIPFHLLKQPGVIADDLPGFIGQIKPIADYYKARFGVEFCTFWLDTLSSGWGIPDKMENDNAYAAATCHQLREICAAIGGPVIIAHHYGKSIEGGLRGASNWKSQSDQVLSIVAIKEEDGTTKRSLEISRSRYGPTGDVGVVDLQYEKLGVDKFGDEFGDCSMVLVSAPQKNQHVFKKSNARLFEECVLECLSSHGIMRRVDGDGPLVKMAKLNQHVRPIMRARYMSGEDDPEKRSAAFRKAWMRCAQEIDANKFFWRENEEKNDNWIWCKA